MKCMRGGPWSLEGGQGRHSLRHQARGRPHPSRETLGCCPSLQQLVSRKPSTCFDKPLPSCLSGSSLTSPGPLQEVISLLESTWLMQRAESLILGVCRNLALTGMLCKEMTIDITCQLVYRRIIGP